MKNLKSLVIVWIGFLALYLLPIGARAGGNDHSGIIVVVEFGKLPAIGWSVTVSSDSGKLITFLPPDQNGLFEMELKPGNYVVTPFYVPPQIPGQPTPNFVIKGPSTPVKVLKNRFTLVELPTMLRLPFPASVKPLPAVGVSENDN